MMRIKTLSLFVLFMLFFLVGGGSFARQTQRKELSKSDWKTLDKNVKALKLWETAGPEWPQIAILRLSADKHRELESDPMEFIKKYKIFDTMNGIAGHSEFRLTERKYAGADDPDGLWMTVIEHDITSYVAYTSFEVTAIK
jgi:hypothetical protein